MTGATPCNGTGDLAVNQSAAYAFWGDTQINAQLVPSSNASGLYDILISTLGETGLGFQPNPGQTSNQSNRGQVQVNSAGSSVQITKADISSDQVTITLSGPPGQSGALSVTLSGPTNATIGTQANATPGNYNFPFGRTTLAIGQYTALQASWTVPGVSSPIQASRPLSFQVLGLTRFSQYNTPTESSCTGTLSTAYIVFNWTPANTCGGPNQQVCRCEYLPTQLRSDFSSQVYVNGTGVSQQYGTIKTGAALAAVNRCPIPIPGSTSTNLFYVFPAVFGACNTGLFNGSLATFPSPLAASTQWSCKDQVLIVKQDGTNDFTGKVQDACPACSGDFRGTNGHIDMYRTAASRNPGTIGDYGNRTAIRLRCLDV